MASAIWGWRLELALGLVVWTLLDVGQLFGAGGEVLVIGLTAITWWAMPNTRRKVLMRLIEARARRRLTSAMWRCQVIGRDGSTPRIVSSENLHAGRSFVVRLPPGLHVDALETRVPEIAAAVGAMTLRCRAVPTSASFAELIVVTRDVLAYPVVGSPLLEADRTSLWDAIPLGMDEDGAPCFLGLPEHNLLIGGEPGSGKSVALSSIVAAAALDPEATLTLLDGKQVELSVWRSAADRFVGPDLEDAVEVLETLRTAMDTRYAHLVDTGRRKIVRDDDLAGLHLVVIDELALYLRGGPRALHEHFAEALRDLVSRGRAAGFIIVVATQKPSHDVVPTWIRDLFSFRIALRCTSKEASDTILGQGWAARGFSATSIDPAHRGVGYLLAEGGMPHRIRVTHLTDIDLAVLAHRAEMLRGGL
jgi:hypothetical protein